MEAVARASGSIPVADEQRAHHAPQLERACGAEVMAVEGRRGSFVGGRLWSWGQMLEWHC
jgi:hypothetical protein